MLARRFTLVCLLATLLGTYIAMLVADAGRGNRPREIAGTLPTLSRGSAGQL